MRTFSSEHGTYTMYTKYQCRCAECSSFMTNYYKHRYTRDKVDQKARAAARYADRSEFLKQAKDKPCTDCGVKYPPYVMDFDHRPGETKLGNIAQVITWNYDVLIKEIAKCDLVCANCHRERTQQRVIQRKDNTCPMRN